MTKTQRIAALEARIATLESCLAALVARPMWPHYFTWTNPKPYVTVFGGTVTDATKVEGTTWTSGLSEIRQ